MCVVVSVPEAGVCVVVCVYLRLVVVLQRHGDHVDADDDSDEQVQVVAGAQGVDGHTQGRVICVVGPLLSLCNTHTHTQTHTHTHTHTYTYTHTQTQTHTQVKTDIDTHTVKM